MRHIGLSRIRDIKNRALLRFDEPQAGPIIERTEPEIKSEGMIVAQAWLDAAEVVSVPCGYTVRCRAGADVRERPRALPAQGWPLKQIELCDAHLKALVSARPLTTCKRN